MSSLRRFPGHTGRRARLIRAKTSGLMEGLVLAPIALALMLLGACTSPGTGQPTPAPDPSPTPTPPSLPTPTPTPGSPAAGLPTIASVVEHVLPAVVSVNTEQVREDFFFRVVVPGAGSGVIVEPDGYIVTNDHVIAGARQITVRLPGGDSHPAEVVGRDPLGDLAVIKIDAEGLPTVTLGDSNELRVGDWVIALGNALALEGGPTVTAGIVSALRGTLLTDPAQDAYLFNVVQTDAAINEGNSGGPLVNLAGEVVGINTVVQGNAQNIGFAQATSRVRRVVDELIATGRLARPFLGLVPESLTQQLADRLGTDATEGVVAVEVAEGPAAKAGLRRGDIILAIGDRAITNEAVLRRVLWSHRPADEMTLLVARNGEERTLTVALGEMPRSVAMGEIPDVI